MKRAKAKPVKAWGIKDTELNFLWPCSFGAKNEAERQSDPHEWLAVVPVTITEGHAAPAKRRKEKKQ